MRTTRMPLVMVGLFAIAFSTSTVNAFAADSTTEDALINFEKQGFGIKNLFDRPGIGVTAYDNDKISNVVKELRCYSPATQKTARAYLKFSASGTWQSTASEEAYKKFVATCTATDLKCAYTSLIEGIHKFGLGQQSVALEEFRTCTERDPGFALGWRLKALAEQKTGLTVESSKSWKFADKLSLPQPKTANEWLAIVTSKMQSGWAERIKTLPASKFPLFQKQGEIIVVLEIQKDGNVSDAKITQSSGEVLLDDFAVQTCMSNSPVAAPPSVLEPPVRTQFKFDMKSKQPDTVAP